MAGQIVNAANQASSSKPGQANSLAYNGSQLGASGSKPNYPSWEDNRPIRGSGTYDINSYDRNYEEEEAEVMGGTLETMELTNLPAKKSAPARRMQESSRFDELKTQDFYDQKLNEMVVDYYPDDFEEVEDSHPDDFYGAEGNFTRLTQKKGNKEMLEVMDEYKKFLTNPQEYQIDNSSHFTDVPSTPSSRSLELAEEPRLLFRKREQKPEARPDERKAREGARPQNLQGSPRLLRRQSEQEHPRLHHP